MCVYRCANCEHGIRDSDLAFRFDDRIFCCEPCLLDYAKDNLIKVFIVGEDDLPE